MKKIINDIFVILTTREKQRGCWLAVADACTSILDIFFLLALLYLVRFYTAPQGAIVNQWPFAAGFNTHPWLPIFIFFILFAVKNAAGFLVAKAQYQFIYGIASRISGELLTQYLHGSYAAYVNIDSAVTNRTISQVPVEFAHYVLNGMQQIFSQCILALIMLLAICLLNPLLLPLLILVLAPPALLVQFLLKPKLNNMRQYGKQTSEQSLQHLQEALQGFVESNVYQKNEFFTNRYHRLQVKLNHYLSGRLIIQSLPPRLMEVFAIFGLLLLVLVNAVIGKSHSIEVVTIGALMVAAYKIIPGMVKITNMISQVRAYSFASESLAAAVHVPIKKPGEAEPIHAIACRDLAFAYPGKNVLIGFNACFQQGDFAVICGDSGKGKTTFIQLLLGFLSPSAGTISINHTISDAAKRQACRAKTAYVKQQSFFLHASIRENISLQEDGADIKKIEQLLMVTGLDEIVRALPGGLNHIVTENGKNFSGGQRQRMAFARALYKDFDLLLLDEPFNELDEASEQQMWRVLQQVAGEGKIVILVTHNTAATSFANKKIVVN